MRVLVTGSSGHVGSAIVRHLAALHWQVVGMDQVPHLDHNLEQEIIVNIGLPGLVNAALETLEPCDAIVHAAASMSLDLFSPEIAPVNCFGTQQILQLAQSWKTARLVYLSSLPVIGEPLLLPIDESHPVNPPTAYHASKLFGEHLVRLAGHSAMATTSLRLTSPVGPRMAANRIVPAFIRRALANQPLLLDGRGLRRQNYVDVRDIAYAVSLCLEKTCQGLFNIAGRASTSNVELAELCIRLLNSSSTIAFSGKPDLQEHVQWEVAIHKAAQSFGYCPLFNMEQSIQDVGIHYASGSD